MQFEDIKANWVFSMSALSSSKTSRLHLALVSVLYIFLLLQVSDWIFAGDINEAGKDSLSAIEESATESPIYVLLVSGLRVGGDSDDSDISLQLLVDFVNGELGGDREAFLASRIAKYGLSAIVVDTGIRILDNSMILESLLLATP